MALTTTEENQLRELLRRVNTTQSGKTVDQIEQVTSHSSVGDYVAQRYGQGSLLRVPRQHLVADLIGTAPPTGTANSESASVTLNHLMTRNATRSEIARLTDSKINDAANLGRTAQASANANTVAINSLQSNHSGRLNALEGWKPEVDTSLSRRLGVIGNVYASNPVFQAGAMNPPGADVTSRTHRFPVPMARDPVIFFSLQGDVNYPRYELLIEGGKVAGFTLFHQPTGGRWIAIGQQA